MSDGLPTKPTFLIVVKIRLFVELLTTSIFGPRPILSTMSRTQAIYNMLTSKVLVAFYSL